MPSYYVKIGLAGYGPDLDPEDEPYALEDLDYVLSNELSRAADYAEETAHALAEMGDFEGAWKEHVRSGSLAIHAANFSPDRRDAPLYSGDLPKWLETVKSQLEAFPLDIGNYERLYVWEAEEV